MSESTQKDWRDLCVAVTNESDTAKLSSLVQELIEALDRRERRRCYGIPLSDSTATNKKVA